MGDIAIIPNNNEIKKVSRGTNDNRIGDIGRRIIMGTSRTMAGNVNVMSCFLFLNGFAIGTTTSSNSMAIIGLPQNSQCVVFKTLRIRESFPLVMNFNSVHSGQYAPNPMSRGLSPQPNQLRFQNAFFNFVKLDQT